MGYDEERSSVHTELEDAAKESKVKAEERYHELEANRHPDLSDAAQVLGRSMGLTSAAIIDPSIRETPPDAVEDPFASGAVVAARHSETGEFVVEEDKLGGEDMEAVQPVDPTVPVETKRKAAKSSES
jgi:phage terminase large subunit-like protein